MTRQILFTGLRKPQFPADRLPDVVVRHLPTIRIAYRAPDRGDELLAFLRQGPRVVFPSKHAVLGIERWLRDRAVEPELKDLEIWAVGESTAAAVRERLSARPRLPRTATANGLIEALDRLEPLPVLLVTGEGRRPELPEWLEKLPTPSLEIHVYRTEVVDNADLRALFRNEPADSVVFSSPSTVRGFLVSVGRDDLDGIASGLVSIGPTTSEEIRRLGGRVALEARAADADSLVQELVRRGRARES